MSALGDIKTLYFNATRATIQRDLTRAVELLKSMRTEDERERATVYMDGLSQMRSEWAAERPRPKPGTKTKQAATRAGKARTAARGGRGR